MPASKINDRDSIPASIKEEALQNLIKNRISNSSPDQSFHFRGYGFHHLKRDLAYVTNYLGNSVSVVDIHLAQEVERIPLEHFAYGIDINPQGDTAYVSHFPEGSISVINILDNTVTCLIDLNSSSFRAEGAAGVKVSHDGTYVYIANTYTHNVSVVHAGKKMVVAEIPLKGAPDQIAVTPDGHLAYVTLPHQSQIAVLDLNFNRALKYISTDSSLAGIDISPAFPLGLATGLEKNHLTAFNTRLAEPSPLSIDDGLSPTGVVFHPRCTLAYVTNQLKGTVSALDLFTHTEIVKIPVGMAPIGIDITNSSNFIVVCNGLDNTASIIDRRRVTTQTVPVGTTPLYVKILKVH